MSTTQPKSCWMTREQAATYCSSSVKTLRRRIAEGALPAFRMGSRMTIRVRQEDLDAMFQQIPTARVVAA
ncbi:hypothetical protein GCM10027030_13170 [Luteococcus sediminum]